MNRFSLGSREIAIAVAAALVLGAVLYFAGRWQARGESESVRQAFELQRSEAQAQLEQVQAQLAAAEDRNHLLLALSTLHKTAVDLDQRNFGVANTHLREAETALRSVSTTSNVVDPSRLDALQNAIAGTDLNVATDLEAQRTRVLEFTSQLEALIPQDGGPAPDLQ